MKWNKRSYSLRNIILLSFVGCLVIALLLQMFLFNSSSSTIISHQTDQFTRNSLENLSSDIYLRLKNIENSLIQIYDYKDFIRTLSTDQSGSGYTALAYEMAQTAFDPDENLVALYIYSMSHEMLSSYRHAQTPIYSYPADIYDHTMKGSDGNVQEIVETNTPVMSVTGYYNMNRGVVLLRCVLRILENAKTPIGYMVCDIDPKGFKTILEKYQYSEAQTIWIQSEATDMLIAALSNDAKTEALSQDLSRMISEGKQPQEIPNYAYYSVPLRKYPVSVYSLIPSTYLNINQAMLQRNTLFVVLIVLFIFGVLYSFLSWSITKPLSDMIGTMNRIKKGETDLRLNEIRQIELGHLGNEFNDMLDRIESLIAKEYLTALQLNDAKYKALQMQVNPHFLYNTLDTMSAIATAKDCPTVSALCKALSDLFRYSLEMEEPLASISDELRHLHNYWYVITTRTGGGISLLLDIPDKLLDEKIPRMSLQPLVENSVMHGLRDKHGEKNIRISAEKSGNILHLMIEDNGIGMSQEVIRKLENASTEEALSSDNSIGLVNINSRLILLYGEDYSLKIRSIIGQGTVITINIPDKRGTA